MGKGARGLYGYTTTSLFFLFIIFIIIVGWLFFSGESAEYDSCPF